MRLSKDEAEREAIRRWYQLPPHERLTYEDAEAYSWRLADDLEVRTITDRRKLIAAWLIRELVRARDEEMQPPVRSAEAA